jgi:cardiolipin synthase
MTDARPPREVRAYRAWGAARHLAGGVRDPAFRDLVQRIDGGPLHRCPPVVLLVDGAEAFRVMMQAIDVAREEVLLETYILRDDTLGTSVQQALVRAAVRGVRVCVLADAVGSIGTDDDFWRGLTDSGVTVRLFHRVWQHPLEMLRRDHRKLLVCDRALAFTGGMNVGTEYGSSILHHEGAWRDTFVQVEGSVARELAAVFAEGWDRARGPALPGLEYVSWAELDTTPSLQLRVRPPAFPLPFALPHAVQRQLGRRRDRRRGRLVRRVIETATPDDRAVLVLDPRPGRGQREMLGVIAALLGGARERLWITTPYFAPPTRALSLLTAAARRGVDVRLLLPSARTDVPIVRHAAHGAYATLLAAGVRVFEYERATLHAKTMVVDGYASLIGSSNLDFRSFWLNAECNVLVLDGACGAAMDDTFQQDLTTSREITATAWRARTMPHRLLDAVARGMRWAL